MSLWYGHSESFNVHSDIDMKGWNLKNLGDAVDDADAISKRSLNSEVSESKTNYEVVFHIDITACYDSVMYHDGTQLVSVIGGSSGRLVQSSSEWSPILELVGDKWCVKPNANGKLAMNFNSPRMQWCDLNVFVVARRLARVSTNFWETIITNDDGKWDKFLGWKGGSDDKLSYGGSLPTRENTSNGMAADFYGVHLLSCHWLMFGSHARLNGIKAPGSDFNSNMSRIGRSYGTIGAIHKSIRRPDPYDYKSNAEFYEILVIGGYMTYSEIEYESKILVDKYGITL